MTTLLKQTCLHHHNLHLASATGLCPSLTDRNRFSEHWLMWKGRLFPSSATHNQSIIALLPSYLWQRNILCMQLSDHINQSKYQAPDHLVAAQGSQSAIARYPAGMSTLPLSCACSREPAGEGAQLGGWKKSFVTMHWHSSLWRAGKHYAYPSTQDWGGVRAWAASKELPTEKNPILS